VTRYSLEDSPVKGLFRQDWTVGDTERERFIRCFLFERARETINKDLVEFFEIRNRQL